MRFFVRYPLLCGVKFEPNRITSKQIFGGGGPQKQGHARSRLAFASLFFWRVGGHFHVLHLEICPLRTSRPAGCAASTPHTSLEASFEFRTESRPFSETIQGSLYFP